MSKRFLALARVSSREQEREGFSLEVQEEALNDYADRQQGEIVKLFRIAETATKPDERRTFKELLAYAKKNASRLDAVLFFKVDRAARNLFDYVELERLEADYGLPVIYITQPTENTPAGRMMRRTLANMASFYTEQQSIDVRDGLNRRVEAGLFPGMAPYGYRNVRHDGRSVVEVHPEHGEKIPRVFQMYAFGSHSLDSLIDALFAAGIVYKSSSPRFPRSKLHAILRDRSYIGELKYHGQWYPGSHPPLVDRATFDRVQVLLGEQTYQAHDLVYGCERITCGHCGHPITGEVKTKQTKKHGVREYTYYRCSRYAKAGHPRIRLREAELDKQVLALFERIRIQDVKVRDWFGRVLRAKARENRETSQERIADLNRQLTSLRNQQDRLLNLRLLEEIDESTFAAKNRELRDRITQLDVQIEGCDRNRADQAELATKVFELSQTLTEKWLTADVRAKRQLLEITCLNFSLEGENLAIQVRKPFDVLAEGLFVPSSRGDRI